MCWGFSSYLSVVNFLLCSFVVRDPTVIAFFESDFLYGPEYSLFC